MTEATQEISIIHKRLKGMVLVSGLFKHGKTFFALGLENPARTAMVDFDFKGEGPAGEQGILSYARPKTAEVGGMLGYDSAKLLGWFRKHCEEELIKHKGQLTHLILDNATYLVDAFDSAVRKNPRKYGVRADNASSGSYGGTNPGIRKIWGDTIAWFQDHLGIQVVTVINHMSQPWVNGAPVANKFNVLGGKAFRQLCILAVVMVPGDPARGGKPPKPSAVVLGEQLGYIHFDAKNGRNVAVKTIPPRLPIAEWPSIKEYLDGQLDFEHLKPGEVWSKFEVSAYGAWMTDDQLEWIKNLKSYSEEGVGSVDDNGNPVMADEIMLNEIREQVKLLKPGTETDDQINIVLGSARVKPLDKLTATEADMALTRIKTAVSKAKSSAPATTEDKPPATTEDKEPVKEEAKDHWATTKKGQEFAKFCREGGVTNMKARLAAATAIWPDHSKFKAITDLPNDWDLVIAEFTKYFEAVATE